MQMGFLLILGLAWGVQPDDLASIRPGHDQSARDGGIDPPGPREPLRCGNRPPYERPVDKRLAAGLTLLCSLVVWGVWRACRRGLA